MTTSVNEKPRVHHAQRLHTRHRIHQASIAEFKPAGVAGADIGAISEAARIALGTRHFHFPTKEHVLDRLERDLVHRIADDLSRFFASPHDLWSTLTRTVRLVLAGEKRLGARLFQDVLTLHFSQTRPPGFGSPTDHPLVGLLTEEIERARDDGLVYGKVDPPRTALFFLLGVYSLLVTNHEPRPTRDQVLEEFLVNTRRGLEMR